MAACFSKMFTRENWSIPRKRPANSTEVEQQLKEKRSKFTIPPSQTAVIVKSSKRRLQCGIGHLPNELVLNIWRSLSATDINSIRLVCSHWHFLSDKYMNTLPRYPIWLCGIASIDGSAKTVKLERINALEHSLKRRYPVGNLERVLVRFEFASDFPLTRMCLHLFGKTREKVMRCLINSALVPNRIYMHGSLIGSDHFTKLIDKWHSKLDTMCMCGTKLGDDDRFVDDRILTTKLMHACFNFTNGYNYFTLDGLQHMINANRPLVRCVCDDRITISLAQSKNLTLNDVVRFLKYWKSIAEKTKPNQINSSWELYSDEFKFTDIRCSETVRFDTDAEIAAEFNEYDDDREDMFSIEVDDYDDNVTYVRAEIGQLEIFVTLKYEMDE